MPGPPFYDELISLMSKANIEVRIDAFEGSPNNAGGYCIIKGKELILLDGEKSKGEQCRVLLEVLEKLRRQSNFNPEALSAALLSKLQQRGNANWLRATDSSRRLRLPKATLTRPKLRLVYDSSREQEQP